MQRADHWRIGRVGREFVRQLAGHARSLILVARREQKLSEQRDELSQQHPNLTVRIRKEDLADLAQLKELMAWLDHERIDVDLLINNAGLGDLGPFVTSDLVRNEQIMLVNMVALTSLTRHLLPPMIARKRGGILNVSSSAGFFRSRASRFTPQPRRMLPAFRRRSGPSFVERV